MALLMLLLGMFALPTQASATVYNYDAVNDICGAGGLAITVNAGDTVNISNTQTTCTTGNTTGMVSLGTFSYIPNGGDFTFQVITTNAGVASSPGSVTWSGGNVLTITVNPTYSVTYNGNGNTGGTVPTDSSSPYLNNASVTVLGNTGTLIKTGYTFNNWNTQAGGGGTSYAAAATFNISANTTLYAQWTAVNTAPVFVASGAGSLTVAESASATDIKSLLHVNDTDSSQTETWTQSVAPSHGTLSFTSATASSGSADITPGGTITYTPTPGYAGTDSFTIQVSDGTATATRVVNVTVSPATVTVGALTLNTMVAGAAFTSQNFVAAGGFGTYTYAVSAGALPTGLSLNASTGALTGTPTSSAIFSFTIQATDSSTGTGPFSGTRVFTVIVSPIPDPIPSTLPGKTDVGVASQVTAKDLQSGNGPNMVTCLQNTLSAQLGVAATYLGQTSDGDARFSLATQPAKIISFYPLNATTNNQGIGIVLGSDNPLTVVTSCGTFGTIPAMFSRAEFASQINAMGTSVQINAQGVMAVQSGSTIYVARPDYVVTAGTPGAPSLIKGQDGLYRFTDSAGNTQVLRPAFLEPDVLIQQLTNGLPAGMLFQSFVIQTDGTGLLTYQSGGQQKQAVLTPDLVLAPISSANTNNGSWNDAPNHYMYRIYTFPGNSQGFSVTAAP